MRNDIKIEYPSSEKIYMRGERFPKLKVGMRQINLTPTVEMVDGKKVIRNNDPIIVYDTSGP